MMNVEINPSEYKILVVDDVVSNVLLMQVLLKKENYQVVLANNGKETLEMVERERPDLILLDIMMPDMDGFVVTTKLKENKETADIPIIFLTALNDTEDVVKGFKIGGSDFISKPFNREELLIRVKHQISMVAAKRIISHQNKELRKIIKARDSLYSVIAHDLRSPIGSVKMVLNMLLLKVPPKCESKDFNKLLLSANQTIEGVFSLLDNLLKWTKIQIGSLHVVKQNVNIYEIIEGIREVWLIIAKTKNIEINFEDEGPVYVYADIDMIKTVVRNLISNALKYSYHDSKINISVELRGDFAKVCVEDFGCGIDEEGREKLLHSDTHYSTFGLDNEEGAGLGLLLSKDMIEKNGGKLWFDSREEKGSNFYFTVPLCN